jgi:UTP--glucose-1-phosphate uridylyltransferase
MEVQDRVYKIEDMVEKPPLKEAPSDLAITGRYILTPEIFDHLENIPPGVGDEIQLTDAMRLLNNIYGYVFPGSIYDIGTTVEWLKSSVEMALADEEVGMEIKEYLKNILS